VLVAVSHAPTCERAHVDADVAKRVLDRLVGSVSARAHDGQPDHFDATRDLIETVDGVNAMWVPPESREDMGKRSSVSIRASH